RFLRGSERFPKTARGKLNTYTLFAEKILLLIRTHGRAGMVLPTGIATDEGTKLFFSELLRSQTLDRLLGFENESFIFPAVHHSTKFCAIAVRGTKEPQIKAKLAFFCRNFDQVRDNRRCFSLSSEDVRLMNPNTNTCPVFRSSVDAVLTRCIYERIHCFIHDGAQHNGWQVTLKQGLFNSTTDSGQF